MGLHDDGGENNLRLRGTQNIYQNLVIDRTRLVITKFRWKPQGGTPK